MNNYGFTNARPGIDMSEVASVKDMIFNKAREKSASLASEREESMTQSVQNDVMQDARSSVMNNRMKPFGNLTKNTNSLKKKTFDFFCKRILDTITKDKYINKFFLVVFKKIN